MDSFGISKLITIHMKLKTFTLLCLAIAIGVALAPYALLAMAWIFGVFAVFTLFGLIFLSANRMFGSLIRILISFKADVYEYVQGMSLAWEMLTRASFPNEVSTLRRRWSGLLVITSGVAWLLLLVIAVLLILFPTRT